MSRFLDCLQGKPMDRPPVWIMRQAGRYLPEYLELRKQCPDFVAFCKNKSLTTQAALQPLARFNLDAAIVFSDILTIPEAMGMGLRFEGGPVFDHPYQDHHKPPHAEIMERLAYVGEAVDDLVHATSVPVIGFAGAPLTLALYMLEGGSSKSFVVARSKLSHAQPLMETLVEILLDYANLQIQAGAKAFMFFDTWANLLSLPDWLTHDFYFAKRLCQAFKARFPHTPLIWYSSNTQTLLPELAKLPIDVLGIDWQSSLLDCQKWCQTHRPDLILQGNLDPASLLTDPQNITHAWNQLLQSLPTHRFIINTGHGVVPQTPPEHVAHWVALIKNSTYRL